jgi:hypothetical protein
MSNVRTFLIVCACALLQACGGGGGGDKDPPSPPGSNNPNPNPPSTGGAGSFTIDATTAEFRLLYHPGQAQPNKTINLTVTNATNVAGVGAAFPAAQGVPNWMHVYIEGTMPNFRVQIIPYSHVQPGHYTATLLVGTGNANGDVLASREIAVTMDVIAPVSVAFLSPVQQTFVFGSDVDEASFSRPVSANLGTWTVASSVPWIRVPSGVQSGSGTLAPVIDGRDLAVGQHTGQVTVENAAFPQQGPMVIPVTVNVQAPTVTFSRTSVLLGGNDGLQLASEPLTATINTGAASYPWSLALSDTDQMGWLGSNVASGTLNQTQAASMQLHFEPSAAAPGTRSGTARVDVTVKGIVFSGSVPVTLNFESHRLVPEAPGVALSSFPSRQRLQRSIRVRSSLGHSNVPWTATSDQPWLNVTASGQTGGQLTLTASPAGLALNTSHIAHVTLTSTEPTIQRSETVRVGFWVSNSDPANVISTQLSRYQPPEILVNPVEPLSYALGLPTEISVHNVYTGALVNTLQLGPSVLATEFALSDDGGLLFVFDENTGNILVLNGNGQSTTPIATYPGFAHYNSYTLFPVRVNGHLILWTPQSRAYDTETHTRLEINRINQTPGAFWGRPVATADGSQVIETNGGQPITITKRSQRLSFVGGKTLTLSNYADLRLGNETFGLGASIAITADQQHAFIGAIINGNGANGDGGVKRVQFSPGQLTVLPNDLFISSRPASDLRSTWDGRMIFGQGFYADEVQDNLLVFDSDGNALGSSMSGPNNGGRIGLAFSGDLFRVVSTHVVPNGGSPPLYVLSFYNLP